MTFPITETRIALPRRRRSPALALIDEASIHKAIVEYLEISRPNCLWHHPANGEIRNKRTAAKLKAMGVVAGCPDLVFTLPGGQSAFMEIKRPGGYLSPAQQTWRDRAVTLGSRYAVVRSLDDAIGALDAWEVLRRAS